MPDMQATAGLSGELSTIVRHPIKRTHPRGHSAFGLRIPFTRLRVFFSDDPGESLAARYFFQTRLEAVHTWPDGSQEYHDFGSGLVTNVACLALANDFAWSTANWTIKACNFHASGTGTTAEAATDIALQTLAAPTTTTAVTGVQTLVSAANLQKYQTVATLNYTSTLAITEWGLHSASALSVTTGTPFTAAGGTSFTATGTPYTASSSSVQGEQLLVVKPGTTAVWGLILSNTTSVGTIPAWYKVSDGTAGSTPGGTEAFSIIPVLFDHRVISAINVVNGSAITWTYTAQPSTGT